MPEIYMLSQSCYSISVGQVSKGFLKKQYLWFMKYTVFITFKCKTCLYPLIRFDMVCKFENKGKLLSLKKAPVFVMPNVNSICKIHKEYCCKTNKLNMCSIQTSIHLIMLSVCEIRI